MGRARPAPASVRRRVTVGAELEDEIGWDAQAARIALAAVPPEPGAVRLLLAEILRIEMAGDAGFALQELLMAVRGVVADRPQADVVVATGRGGVAGAHARIGGALDEAVGELACAACDLCQASVEARRGEEPAGRLGRQPLAFREAQHAGWEAAGLGVALVDEEQRFRLGVAVVALEKFLMRGVIGVVRRRARRQPLVGDQRLAVRPVGPFRRRLARRIGAQIAVDAVGLRGHGAALHRIADPPAGPFALALRQRRLHEAGATPAADELGPVELRLQLVERPGRVARREMVADGRTAFEAAVSARSAPGQWKPAMARA